MKIAFIGTGRISDAHLGGLRALSSSRLDLELAAVVDTHLGRAAAWVGRHFKDAGSSPAVLTDYRELLAGAARPDLVCILVPHHLHLEIARPFLEAGVAVQMQKPIGLGMRDGRELIDIARSRGTGLAVSEPSVLGRGNRLMFEWLRSGQGIGQPTFMIDQAVIDLHGGFFMTPWRHLRGMAGAGWFIDHGVHRTHWMLDAFGPCRTAYARTRQLEATRSNAEWGEVAVDTEDLAAAVLEFESGVVVQWTVMSGGRGDGHGHVQVWGTRGSMQGFHYTPSGETARGIDLGGVSVADDIPDDPFAHSLDELIRRVEDPAHPLVGDPLRALEAEAIVYACLESAHTGAPVAVAEILDGSQHQYEDTVWAAERAARGLDLSRLT